MPTLTGLPALLKRVQVVATSAVAWLTAVSASLVVAAQLLDGIGGIPEWVTRGIASAVAVIAAVTLQVRRVTPVADADKGLLPPKGPAAAADPNRDVGEVGLSMLFLVVALVLFLVVGAIGATWITSEYVFAFLGFGLAAWVLAGLIPRSPNP